MAWIKLSAPERGKDVQLAAARILEPVIDRATRLHARFLVRKYGKAAAQRAFDRAQLFASMGDYWGREMWLKVGRAAAKLTDTEPRV